MKIGDVDTQRKPIPIKGAKGREDRYISPRTVQARDKSRINRDVTSHSSRHSFATYEELLGHKHSKTTEICTHLSTQNVSKIISPLDFNRR